MLVNGNPVMGILTEPSYKKVFRLVGCVKVTMYVYYI